MKRMGIFKGRCEGIFPQILQARVRDGIRKPGA